MKLAVLSAACLLAFAAPALSQEPYKPGNGVTAPRLVKEVKPGYSASALKAGIKGMVRMECVVLTDGTVGEVTIIQPLEPTLDAEAARTLKQWTFSPGLKDGKPVPVVVEVEMTFTTRNGFYVDSPGVAKPGPGVTLPVLVHETKPEYPDGARTAGLQGNLLMTCVVLADGTVGDVRVTRSLNPDLDAAAIRTLRQWRFKAGEKDGKPVPVQVEIEMTFSLR